MQHFIHSQTTVDTTYYTQPGFNLLPVEVPPHTQNHVPTPATQVQNPVPGLLPEHRHNLLREFTHHQNVGPTLIEVLAHDLEPPITVDPENYSEQQQHIMDKLLNLLVNPKCSNTYGGNIAEQKTSGVDAILSDFLALFGDLIQFHNPFQKYTNVAREHTLWLSYEDFLHKFPGVANQHIRKTSRNHMYTATVKFPLLVCYDSKRRQIHFRYVVSVVDYHNLFRPVYVNFDMGRLARRVEQEEREALVTVLAEVKITQNYVIEF
jgi:hypothetical protein